MNDPFIRGIKNKYPEELLEGRVEIEASVCACIWKDPLLLDDVKFKKNLFITDDGRFFYSLAATLKKKGLNVFDEVAVLSNTNEEIIDMLEQRGGYDTIENMTEIIDTANFEAYTDHLYRENNIMRLYDMGFNLFDKVKWEDKMVDPLPVFRKMNSEQVIDFYLTLLDSLEIGQSTEVIEEEDLDLDDDWLSDLQEGIQSGVPFDYAFPKEYEKGNVKVYPFLSNNVAGLLPGTTTMLGAFSSVGKSTWWIGLVVSLVAKGRKVLIISNEENSVKYKNKFMVWIMANVFGNYSMNKRHLQSGDSLDREAIEKAQRWYRDHELNKKIKFIKIKDANMSIVKKKAREYSLKYGFDVLLYDTFKIQSADMRNERQDLALVKDTRTLDQIGVKYKMIVLCSLQLAEGMKGKLWLNSSCLSNSKQIKEQLENLFLMRNLYPEEIDPSSKQYCHPFKRIKVDGRWVEQEMTLDPSKTWKVLFIEKARSGANSDDMNTAFVFEFLGDFSTFREYCSCRPRHGTIG